MLFIIFSDSVQLWDVCLSGGAKRRHLYQDKHTSYSQIAFFCLVNKLNLVHCIICFLVLMCLTSSFFKNFLDNISIHIIFLKKTGILFLGLAKRKVFDKELKMMNFLGESNEDVLTKQNFKRFGSDRFGVKDET